MNGSNGHSTAMQAKKIAPSNNRTRDKSLGSLLSSRFFLCCLGVVVALTIVIDTYLLVGGEFWVKLRAKSVLPKPKLSNNSNKKQRANGENKPSQPTKRRFAFQDEKNKDKLPTLPKANRNFAEKSGKEIGREPILRIFEEAGIPPLDDATIAQLPTWDQIEQVVGPKPIVGGLDTCDAYKQNVPAVERMLGSSGMFNTGTNLVTHLLKKNCRIPERVQHYGEDASKEMHGMRWQVPWGKHSPAKYKELHSTKKAASINKEWIMPVVTIRHPYTWMKSMCKNGYTARWKHGRQKAHCPNLKEDGEWNEVTTKFAEGRTENSNSLAHLWNDWYKMYLEDAKYPRLIVRLEDLMFHAKETTTTICTCVGGEMRTDQPFQYVLDSAKADSRGHDTSTGFVQAWIKYAKPMAPNGDFTPADYNAAKEALNKEFMDMFQYRHPPAGSEKD